MHFGGRYAIISKSSGSWWYPGVAKFGIALEWGSRGLEFESRHSDQEKLTGFDKKLVNFSFCGKEIRITRLNHSSRAGWRNMNNSGNSSWQFTGSMLLYFGAEACNWISGCGEVWYRAWMGFKRPRVRISTLGPKKAEGVFALSAFFFCIEIRTV